MIRVCRTRRGQHAIFHADRAYADERGTNLAVLTRIRTIRTLAASRLRRRHGRFITEIRDPRLLPI
jgi:hypothetical protein